MHQALFEIREGFRKLKEIITAFPLDDAHWNEAQSRAHA
jgi:hypothetical protein